MIHSFIPRVLLEHILCTRHWARSLRYSPYLLGLDTAESIKEINYFKIINDINNVKETNRKSLRKGCQGRSLLRADI